MRSQIARISGNYLRLAVGFVVGLLMVRQLLAYGSDIFNIFTIVTVGAGIGIILRELLRIALTPHLARAWANRLDPGGRANFRRVYGQAMLFSALAGLTGLMMMAGLGLTMPRFDIEQANLDAARSFVAARAAILLVTASLAPIFTMLLVMQRFTRMNLLLTSERVLDFVAVLVPVFALAPGTGGAATLVVFSIASAILVCTLYLFAGIATIRAAPGMLRPAWVWRGPEVRKSLLVSLGWALGLVVAFNLYLRFDTLYINLKFGAAATIAFGLAVQMVGMIRQLASGVATGLDAVAAKFAHSQDNGTGGEYETIHAFSTYLQSLVSVSALTALVFVVDDLLAIWLAGRDLAPQTLELAANLTLIMMIGATSISMSESTYSTMMGRGEMGRFVPWLLAIVSLNVGLLTLGSPLFESPAAVAILYSILIFGAHQLAIPLVFAKGVRATYLALVANALRGAIAPVSAGLLIWLAMAYLPFETPLARIVLVVAIIGATVSVDLIWKVRNRRRV